MVADRCDSVAALLPRVLIFGILSRLKAERSLRAVSCANWLCLLFLSCCQKQPRRLQEVILPGNVQPFISSPIYARTDGYLKKWYFDIGAHVKAGQLLAVIQAPEVDEQLAQARSNLATAQANLRI